MGAAEDGGLGVAPTHPHCLFGLLVCSEGAHWHREHCQPAPELLLAPSLARKLLIAAVAKARIRFTVYF